MAIQAFLQTLFDLAKDHWFEAVMAIAVGFGGWYIGKTRARAKFKKREYFDRINFSLNILRNGKLHIRTLAEMRCEEVFLNAAAASDVSEAAIQTTPENCLLPLPEKDYWQYLNAVLNEISERFATGFLRFDLGLNPASQKYVIALTSEAAGALRTRKVRAMIIREDSLLNLPKEMPELESPEHHVTRWETLNFLASEYRRQPHCFLTVDISV